MRPALLASALTLAALPPAGARAGAWSLPPGAVRAQACFRSTRPTRTFFEGERDARRSALGDYRWHP